MVACARQYLGALEDNARLSHDRALAGRYLPGHEHTGRLPSAPRLLAGHVER